MTSVLVRAAAARALHNLLRDFTESLWQRADEQDQPVLLDDSLHQHPVAAVVELVKLSFDEQQRSALCQLGGLYSLAELVQAEHETHGPATGHPACNTTRRFASMALTNLTFGDGTSKALLCGQRAFMRALVTQLHSPSEELVQVTASVLRNLSWRADSASKQALREAGAVTALTRAALATRREPALKPVLSALWNLSAHCALNKADICAEENALSFIVKTLNYESPSKTLAIVENGGGILRNISSHIAVREDYRQVLRQHGCIATLLQHLNSPSLTVVSNACGTLWNLSARCTLDQRALWRLGAVPRLRALVHSPHQMIASGSGAALQNLLAA
ncbi:adenomatous polyposis coli protein 2-like, partial [Pollicipes pollicipes]|uniref:adenomatous polyposis coli protein 2-like n=1 Tax=Pollicipes pollicipes TaxID=41117 RepID=UPI001884D6F8